MDASAAGRFTAPYKRRGVRPSCPHCSDILFAPSISVHVHDDDVRHWWTCDMCGYEFMTMYRFCGSVLRSAVFQSDHGRSSPKRTRSTSHSAVRSIRAI